MRRLTTRTSPSSTRASFGKRGWWSRQGKKQLTIRLDADVLSWLKDQGRGYQSRINAILRAYYEAHQGNAR